MTWPGNAVYRPVVATTATIVERRRKPFRNPPLSARAPASGETSATAMAEKVTPLDHSVVPTISSGARDFTKYVE